MPLTNPDIADALLKSVAYYHARHRWWCHLFLLMPDHLHALLAFPRNEAMSRVIGEWKHYHATHLKIRWQEGYFDHRIRDTGEFHLKTEYIRQNPVAKKLCAYAEDWPWSWNPENYNQA